jgi:uncharacterized protein Yka (UPF0111/DUF47 family)
MRIRWPTVHWFLPSEPDVLGGLRKQMTITVSGMQAFAAWAAGDVEAADRVSQSEHDADEAKREVRVALRDAFITPISAEDIFILSQLLDNVLNASKDVVREAEVMDMPPDEPMAEMAGHLLDGTMELARAFEAIDKHGGNDGHRTATAAADAATKSMRRMEKVYRRAMGSLLHLDSEGASESEHEHVRELMGRRELYRRLARIAGSVVDVADRVWYAAVKEM